MTVQWRVDGRDSDGRETLFALMADGRDTELRVGCYSGTWWVARMVPCCLHDDASLLGTFIDVEHAQAAAVRRVGS